MDKDIEERLKIIETVIENQFLRHEKKITELRAQFEVFKGQFGQSDILNKLIHQRRPTMGIKNAIRTSSTPAPGDLDGWKKYADAAQRDYNVAMDEISRIETETETEGRRLTEKELEIEVEPGVGGVVATREGKRKIGGS